MLGTLSDFDFSKEAVNFKDLTAIDKWALAKFYHFSTELTKAYDEYSFNRAFHLVNLFFTVDLSATYLDILKDRLYTWKKSGLPRKSAQTVIFIFTDHLLRMMAPILSFLSEEAYGYLKKPLLESVFLEDFPKPDETWKNSELLSQFDEMLKVRSDVQKDLEALRAAKTIGSSLEAQVHLSAEGQLYDRLKAFDAKGGLTSDLREFLIVSKVTVTQGKYQIQVTAAHGEKCSRCWIYSDETGKDSTHPGICPKCVEALRP
jgi:isoleucyl-tRNA synthetase